MHIDPLSEKTRANQTRGLVGTLSVGRPSAWNSEGSGQEIETELTDSVRQDNQEITIRMCYEEKKEEEEEKEDRHETSHQRKLK